jgi:hypothetical protein
MKQLGLKNLSRDLQINCAISYLFYLYLMFHTYAARFDIIGNLVKFWVFGALFNVMQPRPIDTSDFSDTLEIRIQDVSNAYSYVSDRYSDTRYASLLKFPRIISF